MLRCKSFLGISIDNLSNQVDKFLTSTGLTEIESLKLICSGSNNYYALLVYNDRNITK